MSNYITPLERYEMARTNLHVCQTRLATWRADGTPPFSNAGYWEGQVCIALDKLWKAQCDLGACFLRTWLDSGEYDEREFK